MFQPFFSVVKDLKMLILADRRTDRQGRPSCIAFQWFIQAELIFQYGFLYKSASIILVTFSDSLDADCLSTHANKEHYCNCQVDRGRTS